MAKRLDLEARSLDDEDAPLGADPGARVAWPPAPTASDQPAAAMGRPVPRAQAQPGGRSSGRSGGPDVDLAIALEAYALRRVSLVGAIQLSGTSMTHFLAVARHEGVLECFSA